MQINLTNRASSLVEKLMASGAYSTADDAVEQALSLLERELELETALAEGAKDFEQGRFRDAEAAFANLRRVAAERVAQSPN